MVAYGPADGKAHLLFRLPIWTRSVRPHARRKTFFRRRCGRTSRDRTCPVMYEWFHFWNAIPWSPTFFPAAGKECRPRKGAPPRVSGLNFETPAYVRATRSLRSLKHGASASRRRSQNFPLRGGRERNGRGAEPILTLSCMGCVLHARCICFSYTGAGPHRNVVRVHSFTTISIFGMGFHGLRHSFPPANIQSKCNVL